MSTPSSAEAALEQIDRRNFAAARDLARQVIAQRPDDALALRALGIAEFALGQQKEAFELLRRSVRADPSQALSHLALGNVLHEQGRLDAAIASYRRAQRLDPDLAQARNDLGAALYARGSLEEAIAEFEAALKRDPDSAMAHENLGSALRRAGRVAEARRALSRSLWLRLKQALRRVLRLRAARTPAAKVSSAPAAALLRLYAAGKVDEALAECERLLAADPDNAEALHIKGLDRLERQDAAAALPYLERAIAARPNIPEFHNSRGICLRKLGESVPALDAFAKAIELNPDFTEAHLALAQACSDVELFDEAERSARVVLGKEPAQLQALHSLARALQGQGRYAEMEAVARDALKLDPDQPESWLYLGQAQRERDDVSGARQAFEKALSLDPKNVMAHLTMGVFILETSRDAESAIAHYRRARPLEAPLGPSAFNEALTRFSTADYSSESWALYEGRRNQGARAVAYRKIPLPEWEGPAQADCALLVYGEQGIGDEIMFASMVPEAARSVRRCVLACDPRLQPLFSRSFPEVTCVAWTRGNLVAGAAELQGATATVPAGSLGRYFRAGVTKFPARRSYLTADPVKVEKWRARLRELGSPPYLGIAWEGGQWKTGRIRRSISLSRIAEHVKGLDARWVSLQRGADPATVEAEARDLSIVHWPDAVESVEDTAALIAALDGVVSVCSWIVHLAGALGRPTITLGPYAPEWRYGLRGDRMLWYPTVRILRQPRPGAWEPLLDTLREDLLSDGLVHEQIDFAGAPPERRAALLNELRSRLSPLQGSELDALRQVLWALSRTGFHRQSDKAWLQTVFETLALPWLGDALQAGRASLALQLETTIYEGFVKATETQAHFRRAFESWLPAMRAAGSSFAAREPRAATGGEHVGFFVHRAGAAAHIQALTSLLQGMSAELRERYAPRLYIFSGGADDLEPQLRALGLPVRYLQQDSAEADWDWSSRLKRLRGLLAEDGVSTLVWVSVATMMPLAFAMRMAPVQIWWALKYHALEFKEIDGYITCGGAGGMRRMEGRDWRMVPLGTAGLFDASLAPQAAAVRADYRSYALLFGCFAREEKLQNDTFLETVARILRACPGSGFLWTGRERSPSVQGRLEALGVADRCHFIGWVNTRLYAQVIDVFLDSFPFPCGYTLYEAMSAAKPAVLLATKEADATGLHAVAGPLLRGESGTAAEQATARSIFAADTEPLYLCADSPEQYVAHAVRLATSPALRRAVGEANRRFIDEYLSDRGNMARWFFRHVGEIQQEASLAEGRARDDA